MSFLYVLVAFEFRIPLFNNVDINNSHLKNNLKISLDALWHSYIRRIEYHNHNGDVVFTFNSDNGLKNEDNFVNNPRNSKQTVGIFVVAIGSNYYSQLINAFL